MNKKRKIIFILMLAGFLVMSSVFVSGKTIKISTSFEKDRIESDSLFSKSGSHPVLVEFFTNSNQPGSVITSTQLYDLYSESYPYSSARCDFYYVTMLTDINNDAKLRAEELGITSYPAVYFDGGYSNLIGVQDSKTQTYNYILDAGSRDVANIQMMLDATWSQCPCHKEITMDINIYNNDDTIYNGQLVISIVMVDSKWGDNSGRPYNYVFLEYITNEEITIGTGASGKYENNYMCGSPEGVTFDNGNIHNFLVVATVFSKETGFLDAIFIDGGIEGEQPKKPAMPTGQVNVKVGETYEYITSSIDVDGEKIKYLWDWDGDYKLFEHTDFYNSDEEAKITHTWSKPGGYNIRVKAKDENGLESFWSDPLAVSIPKNQDTNKFFNTILLEWFIEKFPLLEQRINVIWR